MIEFLDAVLHYSELIAGLIWWPLVIIMLFSVGIYMSFQTGFVQFKRIALGFSFIFKGRTSSNSSDKGEITPYQSLMTSLAAIVGNGNIAGVATAIVAGGPGATFWMWLTAMFGMSTKFAEGLLGQKFRIVNADGTYSGGAMYYLQDGIEHKKLGRILAILFSFAVVFMATLGSGNMAQSNSIANALYGDFNVEYYISAIVIFIGTAIILLGGIKRIAEFAEKLVPIMILFYVGTGFVIVLMNISKIPEILVYIVTAAFDPKAVAGGVLGATIKDAIRFGVARGTLSNESGIGSCSIPSAAAKGNEPVAQGLVAMMGTFIDTIIVCSMTSIVIAASQVDITGTTGLTSVQLTKSAFSLALGSSFGNYVVSISAVLFGFTTLVAWAYFGEIGIKYLFPNIKVKVYRYSFCVFAAIGAVLQGKYLSIVWNFGDIANAFMAIPNIIGLFLLGKIVKAESQSYFKRWDSKELKNPFG